MNNIEFDLIIKILNKTGSVIAINTDTVYGFVCNANDKIAVNKIYNIKNREENKPLSIFIKNKNDLEKFINLENINDSINNLIDKYWPGALTLIFKTKNDTYNYLTKNTNKIGIRVPNDKNLLIILNSIDFPLAQTSCNYSGEEPLKTYISIKNKFSDKVDYIVKSDKQINNNLPSTVLDVSNNSVKVLRLGAIKL